MINPSAIPTIPGDMAALTGHASTIAKVGADFPATGAQVDRTWQGLAAVYSAPEAGDLLAATAPVQTVTASVGEDLTAVGSALTTYASEVTTVKARLDTLRTQAVAFVNEVAGDDDWHDSQDKVDRHNALITGVDAAVADFMDAQRRCANSILALYSTKRWTADNGDGTVTDSEYGYSAAQLDAAMGQQNALPWGTSEEHDRGFLGDVGAFFVGIGDGAKGFVVGLGGLIGYADGSWSWSTAGNAWKGLGMFAIALGVYSNPLTATLDQTVGIPGFDRGQNGALLLNAGKVIIAYDEWGKDKSKAAGMATFNLVSAIIGTKGAGAALRGTGAAVEATEIAGIARVGTMMVRAGDVMASLPTVSDVLGATLRKFPGLRIPAVDIPHVDVPTVHVDTPHTPHVEAPHPSGHGPSVGDTLPRSPHVDTPHVDTPHVDTPGTPAHAGTPHPAIPHTTVATPHSAGATAPHPSTPHPTPAHPDPAGTGPTHDAPSPGDPAPGPTDGVAGRPDPTDLPPGLHPSDLGTRPDGSWVGAEHGVRLDLDPAANAAADRVLGHAAAAEPRITPQIHAVVDHEPGAQMPGEEFARKGEDSLKRKIATELERNPDLTPAEAAANIRDGVRYTMQIPDASYARGVERAVAQMQERGFVDVDIKPTWDAPGSYKGVNTTWYDPRTGQIFELQFHTAESFAAKMETHPLYEAMRVPGIPPAEVARLAAEQARIFERVPVPAGTSHLLDLRETLSHARTASGAPHHVLAEQHAGSVGSGDPPVHGNETGGEQAPTPGPETSGAHTDLPADPPPGRGPADHDSRHHLTRQDDDFTAATDHRGLRKSHLDALGNLVPANPSGTTAVVEHVVGRDRTLKADSPYTSFSGDTRRAKAFGSDEIRVDVERLAADVGNGQLRGVQIVPPDQVQALIQRSADEIAGRHVELPPTVRRRDLHQWAATFGLDPSNSERLMQRARDMYNTRRDDEWLIKGVIPAEYIRGPA